MPRANVSKLATKRRPAVPTKQVRDSKGNLVKFFMVDGSRATLGDDLTYVFKENIKRAREENRKLFGSVDGVRKK